MPRCASASAVPFLALVSLALPARAQQPTTSPPTTTVTSAATQPAPPVTTQPAVNELRSPRATVEYFLAAAQQAADAFAAAQAVAATRPTETDEPAAVNAYKYYSAPMRCLDFGKLADDAERLRDEGPRYVRELHAILRRLIDEGIVDIEDEEILPDKAATADPWSFGRDPLVLTLTRLEQPVPGQDSPLRVWKFSQATVGQIDGWYENLDAEIEKIEAEEPALEIVPAFQTPQGLVKHFLDAASRFRETKDEVAYREALRCLDMSAVYEEQELATDEARQRFLDENAPRYIEGLDLVLDRLMKAGHLELDNLPAEPDPAQKPSYAINNKESVDPNTVPLEVLLVRRGDVALAEGQWRFSADTVRRVPPMAEALRDAAKEAGAPLRATQGPHGSPRATFSTFLTAMRENRIDDAVACLDIVDEDASFDVAKSLAGKLWLVLARKPKQPVQQVPDNPDLEKPYTLFEHRLGRIEIAPVEIADGARKWLISPDSVEAIEPLYEAYESEPIHPDWRGERLSFWTLPALYMTEYVMPNSFKRDVLGLKVWQWIGVPAAIGLGVLVFYLCQVLLPRIAGRVLASKSGMLLPSALKRAMRPTSALIMVLVWRGVFPVLDLGSLVTTQIIWVSELLAVIFAAAGVFRLVGVGATYFAGRAVQTQSRLDDVLVPLLDKTLKVVAVALGVVFTLNVAFDVDSWRLLAGLGVGGFAVAFAAQDTIKNFFGSVNVVLDRPFQVGDWVKIGSTEGIVEAVGLRSSKIRTFWKSQIVVPNSEIMNATIENYQRRTYRRTYAVISVTYSTTPEQLEAFCEGIRELVRQHEHTWKDYYQVYVKGFAASSIDIMLYCFHDVPDWGRELAERHRLLIDIVRLANRLGVDFAFPTQTVHLYKEEPGGAASPVPNEPKGALRFGQEQAQALLAELKANDDAAGG